MQTLIFESEWKIVVEEKIDGTFHPVIEVFAPVKGKQAVYYHHVSPTSA